MRRARPEAAQPPPCRHGCSAPHRPTRSRAAAWKKSGVRALASPSAVQSHHARQAPPSAVRPPLLHPPPRAMEDALPIERLQPSHSTPSPHTPPRHLRHTLPHSLTLSLTPSPAPPSPSHPQPLSLPPTPSHPLQAQLPHPPPHPLPSTHPTTSTLPSSSPLPLLTASPLSFIFLPCHSHAVAVHLFHRLCAAVPLAAAASAPSAAGAGRHLDDRLRYSPG